VKLATLNRSQVQGRGTRHEYMTNILRYR